MARIKAIIRGAYGEGNFGDDVLMVACHGLLRRIYAADEIAFRFASQPSESERAYVERLLPGINIIRFEADASAELVVWGGGTQFYSFSGTRTVTPFYRKALAGLLDPKKAYNYLVRKTFNGKYNSRQRFAALGVGIGPFVSGSAEEGYTRDLFSCMDFVAVRDDDSMRLCQTWNVTKAALRSDLCFLPGVWWPEQIQAIGSSCQERQIGIIVRDWPHDAAGAAYDAPLLSAVGNLRKAGYAVSFIIFRADGDSGWVKTLNANGESFLSWKPASQSIADFLGMLNGFDCFLTARYHGALFGALLGKSVICIEVEPKLRLVSELLGCHLWKQPFEASNCIALIEETFQNYDDIQDRILEAVRGQRELAASMMQEFLAFATGRALKPAPALEQAFT